MTNIQTEVAQFLDSIADDNGNFYTGNVQLILQHDHEQLDCTPERAPAQSKLDVVNPESGRVIATFNLASLTLSQLNAHLSASDSPSTQAKQYNDVDNLPIAGLNEVDEATLLSINVTIQRPNTRVTRYFEGANYHPLYLHALKAPNVLLVEFGI